MTERDSYIFKLRRIETITIIYHNGNDDDYFYQNDRLDDHYMTFILNETTIINNLHLPSCLPPFNSIEYMLCIVAA